MGGETGARPRGAVWSPSSVPLRLRAELFIESVYKLPCARRVRSAEDEYVDDSIRKLGPHPAFLGKR